MCKYSQACFLYPPRRMTKMTALKTEEAWASPRLDLSNPDFSPWPWLFPVVVSFPAKEQLEEDKLHSNGGKVYLPLLLVVVPTPFEAHPLAAGKLGAGPLSRSACAPALMKPDAACMESPTPTPKKKKKWRHAHFVQVSIWLPCTCWALSSFLLLDINYMAGRTHFY